MALTLDTSKPFRSVPELTELVQAIATAPLNESEPDWVEWKREADLTNRRWFATIAKCIAGFANREPRVARQSAGGCAYMICGAEPGKVHGVSPIDNADLHAGISRYVRSAVRWSPQYVRCQGEQVLVVTVEPPEYGDQIVAMLADFQPQERGGNRFREGDVFIRRHGKTEPAKQEDYEMLANRFAGGGVSSGEISVRTLDTVTAVAVARDFADIDTWWERQEREFLEPLDKWVPTKITPLLSPIFESRSPEEYRSQVTSYLSDLASLAPSFVRYAALEKWAPGMRLLLVNETEQNFVGARVEVFIEGDVWAYRRPEDARPEMPQKLRKWGTSTGFGLYVPPRPEMPILDMFGPHIDNSGSATIRFDDVDLRPGERVELDPIYLVADAALAGATLAATWVVTSSNANGAARGEISITVATEVYTLHIEQ